MGIQGSNQLALTANYTLFSDAVARRGGPCQRILPSSVLLWLGAARPLDRMLGVKSAHSADESYPLQ